jgi:hypothetical protein
MHMPPRALRLASLGPELLDGDRRPDLTGGKVLTGG